jgi:hypothetical protein
MMLVRMQADGRLPIEQRRNYRNVVHGIEKAFCFILLLFVFDYLLCEIVFLIILFCIWDMMIKIDVLKDDLIFFSQLDIGLYRVAKDEGITAWYRGYLY